MKQKIDFTSQSIPFTQVANNVLADKRLKIRDKGLFAYLYSKPEDWEFNFKRIAQDSDDGAKIVLASLKNLEKYGYLNRSKLGNGKVVYSLMFEPSGQNGDQAQEPKSPFWLLAKKGTITNIVNTNTTNIVNTPPIAPQIKKSEFSVFWGIYPKKIAKPAAEKAWAKIKSSEYHLVLNGVAKWKASRQWLEENGRFIPHPATFLNQRRWEDEIEVSEKLSVKRY